jgi:hypothetical protein
MSNPAVVILTDPAQCQLADAETLVQVLLQVQQLNAEGVPSSQTFCDHPAAAMDSSKLTPRPTPPFSCRHLTFRRLNTSIPWWLTVD